MLAFIFKTLTLGGKEEAHLSKDKALQPRKPFGKQLKTIQSFSCKALQGPVLQTGKTLTKGNLAPGSCCEAHALVLWDAGFLKSCFATTCCYSLNLLKSVSPCKVCPCAPSPCPCCPPVPPGELPTSKAICFKDVMCFPKKLQSP